MKRDQDRLEKQLAETQAENRRLTEPLQKAREEVAELQRQLGNYERDKVSLSVSLQLQEIIKPSPNFPIFYMILSFWHYECLITWYIHFHTLYFLLCRMPRLAWRYRNQSWRLFVGNTRSWSRGLLKLSEKEMTCIRSSSRPSMRCSKRLASRMLYWRRSWRSWRKPSRERWKQYFSCDILKKLKKENWEREEKNGSSQVVVREIATMPGADPAILKLGIRTLWTKPGSTPDTIHVHIYSCQLHHIAGYLCDHMHNSLLFFNSKFNVFPMYFLKFGSGFYRKLSWMKWWQHVI